MCINCDNPDYNRAITWHTCRVCELIEDDKTIKRTRYCKSCKVYVCEKHRLNFPARAFAAAMETVDKFAKKAKRLVSRNKDQDHVEKAEVSPPDPE